MMRVRGLTGPGLVGVAMLTMAAGPSKSDFSTYALLEQPTVGVMAGSAGRKALAEPTPAGGFAPAPVPDIDLLPHARAQGTAQPELSADLFIAPKSYRGEGYLPGSTVQGSQNRHVAPAPGFSLKVPLE